MVRWLVRSETSVEGDGGSSPFALTPTENAEGREEQGAEQGEHELDVALRVLASVAELLVLLLDGVVVVVRVELGARDALVGEVGFAEDLGACRDEIRVAAHPVEGVLEREDGPGEVLLGVRTGEHLQLLVAAHGAHHRELTTEIGARAGTRER